MRYALALYATLLTGGAALQEMYPETAEVVADCAGCEVGGPAASVGEIAVTVGLIGGIVVALNLGISGYQRWSA